MKIYNYHPVTREFVSESLADESPLEPGVFLIPAFATTIPPVMELNKKTIWQDGLWELVDLPQSETAAPPDLDEIKAQAIFRIKAKRNAVESAGFPYCGKILDSDMLSVQRIGIAAQAAQISVTAEVQYTVDWTCADNTTLTLDAKGVLGMPVALAAFSNGLHTKARAAKEAITTATTAQDVQNIVDSIVW